MHARPFAPTPRSARPTSSRRGLQESGSSRFTRVETPLAPSLSAPSETDEDRAPHAPRACEVAPPTTPSEAAQAAAASAPSRWTRLAQLRSRLSALASEARRAVVDIAAGKQAGALEADPDLGLIEQTARRLRSVVDPYFRPEVRGLEHVPDEPAMLVGNHDGGYLAVDGICLGLAWHERFGFRRPLVWLMHDVPFRLSPSLTRTLSLHGVHPACRASVARAFDAGRSLFVYPGGSHEAFRPYLSRRSIDLGNRTGFVAEALARRVPIVPIVSVGAHETLFVVSRGKALARRLPLARRFRTDVLPLWLGLPWGVGFGPLPHLPLPAKVTVEALPPIRLWERLGPDADPSDPVQLQRGLELVRGEMQAALDRLYAERRWPVLG
jgi:1-acyl-sn-glycerol-3-phosphate acyltransferase